jgi:hypothetical protein
MKNQKGRRSTVDYSIGLTCRWLVENGVQPSEPLIGRQPLVEIRQVVENCPRQE